MSCCPPNLLYGDEEAFASGVASCDGPAWLKFDRSLSNEGGRVLTCEHVLSLLFSLS